MFSFSRANHREGQSGQLTPLKNQHQGAQTSPLSLRDILDMVREMSKGHSPCPRPFSQPKLLEPPEFPKYAADSLTHSLLGKILFTWSDLGQEQGNSQNQKELHELWMEIGGF